MPIPSEKFLKVSAKSARNCWDRRRGKLFIVIVFLCLDNQDSDTLVVDVVDDGRHVRVQPEDKKACPIATTLTKANNKIKIFLISLRVLVILLIF